MEDVKFEKAIERLEKIVEFLEGADVPLDEALKKYEEGVKLSSLCSQKLAQAEKKVEILTRTLNGTLKAEPFHPEEGDTKEKKRKKAASGPVGESSPAADTDTGESLF